MAAVCGIPLVVFFGITPSGLNASSEGEIHAFHDWTMSRNESLGTPLLTDLLKITQLSLWGEIDPDIGFVWEPLWTLDEKQAAEVRKIEAETADIYINGGVISTREQRQVIAHEDDSPWAGIDLTVDPVPPANEPEPGSEDDRREMFGGEHDHQTAMDEALPEGHKWITTENGTHLLIDGDGVVKGGAGGKLNGQKLAGHGKSEGAPAQRQSNHVSASHHATIKAYTGSNYRQINGHLRGGVNIDPGNKHHIDQLDDLFGDVSAPEKTTVYRALGSLAAEQLLGKDRKVKKGQMLEDPGFVSTSSNLGSAQQFFNVSPKTVMMHIAVPKGAKALDVSKYSDAPSEKETLLARGSAFKVVKYDLKARKLEVEMLPHDAKPTEKPKKVASDAAPSDDGAFISPEHFDKFTYTDAVGLILHPSDDPDAEEFDLS